MSAATRLVRSLAFSGAVALCSTPAVAANGGFPLPDVDFTVAHVPYVPSVTVVLPPALLTDAVIDLTAAEPAPLAEAAQMRPVDLPRARPAGEDFSTSLRRSMYVSFAALQVMDVVSTRKALSNGATEANPAMAGLAGNSAAFVAVKAGTAAATTFFAERLARKHPRRATILMAVLNTAYAAIVVHNYRVAGSNR